MMYSSKVLHLPRFWQHAAQGTLESDLLSPPVAPPVNQTLLARFQAGSPSQPAPTHAAGSHEIVEPRTLYWFRWVSGHQTSFLIWTFLLLHIKQYQAGACSMASLEKTASALFKLYSGILVYTASTSIDVYQQIIRPFMMTYHPGFSGSWACDYARLKETMRQSLMREGGSGKLSRAYMATNQIHGKIGKRLVGHSPSLNKLAKQAKASQTHANTSAQHVATPAPDADLAFIFDAFFLVQRSPVGYADLLNQLVSRLSAILDDYHQHGFQLGHPGESPTFLAGQHDVWDHLPRHALDCVNALLHAAPNHPG